jgi:peptidoglycan/xylan/chitin deacetylase (PgdA/CDA1 family)
MFNRLWRLTKPFYPRLHRRLAPRHPEALWRGDPAKAQIALTFDDGPSERDTPALLRVLERHGVPATFFLVGERLEHASGRPAAELRRAGHQPALHGYRHRPFPLQRTETLRRELDRARDLVAEQCAMKLDEVRDVRPPFGLFTSGQLARTAQWGYRTVMWTHVTPHWAQPAEQSVAELVRDTTPGALIVLHEGRPDGPPVAEIAEALIPRLLERGLAFVRVEQMTVPPRK